MRYISWAAMILDPRADVRAEGYRSAPANVSGAEEALARALDAHGAIADDAITFLEAHRDPRARDVLVAAMEGKPPLEARWIRAAISTIDARRHVSDSGAVVPGYEPWPDQPAPAGWAASVYPHVDRHIATLRRQCAVTRRQAHARGEVADDGAGSWLAHARSEIAAYSAITFEDCDEAARAIGGDGVVHPLIRRLASTPAAPAVLREGLTPLQRLRLESDGEHSRLLLSHFDYGGLDLRLLADAARRMGVRRADDHVALTYLSPTQNYLGACLAWPFFAEHPGPLDDFLGLAVPEVATEDKVLVKALDVLVDMPVLPRRYLPRAIELATVGRARPRAAARRVVGAHGDPVAVAVGALRHGRSTVRAGAATWLAELGAAEARPAIDLALDAEMSGPARHAMTAALVRLRA